MFKALCVSVVMCGIVGFGLAARADCGKNKGKSFPTEWQQSRATPAGQAQVVLAVEGMRCGGCAGKISAALKKLAGISALKIDVSTRRATVTYAPKQVRPEAMIQTISKLGYKASVTKG